MKKTAISWNFACHMSLAPRETAEKPWTPVIARVQSMYGNVFPNLAKPWEWLWDKSVQRVKDLLQLFSHFLLVIWCQIGDLPFVTVFSLEKMMQNVLIYTNLSTQKSSSGHRSKRACIFLGAYHQHKNSHKHVSLVCMYDCVHFLGGRVAFLNIAKGTTDPRVEFISQDQSAQLTRREHITISESWLSNDFKISTKHQHLN